MVVDAVLAPVGLEGHVAAGLQRDDQRAVEAEQVPDARLQARLRLVHEAGFHLLEHQRHDLVLRHRFLLSSSVTGELVTSWRRVEDNRL